MGIDEISTLIGSVGFPIAACVVLFIQNGKLQETLSAISTTMQSLAEKIADIERKMEEK